MRWSVAACLAIGLLSGLTGCEDDRLVALEVEIARLEKARVPREAVEEAKRELALVESDREAARDALRTSEARARALEEGLAQRVEKVEREIARTPGADVAAVASAKEEAELRERAEKVRRVIADRLEEARDACERVVEVEGQLRDSDPDWAAERRRAVVEELVRAVADRHPADPVLRDLAASLDGPTAPRSASAPEQTRWARALAERLRARLVSVYGERVDPRGPARHAAKTLDGERSAASASEPRGRCPIAVPTPEPASDSGA